MYKTYTFGRVCGKNMLIPINFQHISLIFFIIFMEIFGFEKMLICTVLEGGVDLKKCLFCALTKTLTFLDPCPSPPHPTISLHESLKTVRVSYIVPYKDIVYEEIHRVKTTDIHSGTFVYQCNYLSFERIIYRLRVSSCLWQCLSRMSCVLCHQVKQFEAYFLL